MAIRNKSNTTVTGVVPPNLDIPVTCRVKKASFEISDRGQGNRYIKWICEILSPDEVELDGKKYNLDSLEVPIIIMLENKRGDQTGYIVNELHPKLGLPEEIDDENPNVGLYENLKFDMQLRSEEQLSYKKEKDANNKPVPNLDENGKPRSLGWKLIAWPQQIYGLSTKETNKAF